ncbi:NAD binding domain of 6-phosphogluconate dehydrogenase [Paenibacillus konkukensis]|uniref:NAD binding domain of 6-phosphogluconate dehydrogenase n=1 Tax=Paenibacillus konkukensis TaxID=2020716 RepID=A0ABY4RLC1_9BACL|nr:DUF1932 domain-containing protein [Paenibacillus konkukensis]UQZ82102.1 NAD binding domain of 6-phosphogluconate dehydrogenase [Paenibacillus konkukensis]
MQLGFIGFGEAAFSISCGLKEQGIGDLVAYDPVWDHPTYGAQVQGRAETAQVELAKTPEEVLRRANVLIVAVPADKALGVSETVKPHLKAGDLYIDVSAASPKVKKAIWETIGETGAALVDAAMVGALLVDKHKVPILASGSGTDRFMELMTPLGMNITKVSETPGDASAIKLIRSIFMKGFAALGIELLEAAHHFNVEQLVISGIGDSLDGKSFEWSLNRMVTGTAIHAQRRIVELEGSIEMLRESDIDSVMSEAVKAKLKRVASHQLKEKFQGVIPGSWLEVIEAIRP